MARLFTIILIFLLSKPAYNQELNFIHYDTRNGLAGSTVYDVCQDKEGYIWFATENGLSRFDGTRFENFTVKEGLPDNEVLKIFADSRGRIWIGTFSKEVCYYYKGRIYNKNNDKRLRDIRLYSSPHQIEEWKDSMVIIITRGTMVIFPQSQDPPVTINLIKELGTAGDFGCSVNQRSLMIFKGGAPNSEKTIELYEFNMDLKKPGFTSRYKYQIDGLIGYIYTSVDENGFPNRPLLKSHPGISRVERVGNKNLFANSSNGVWLIDTAANKWDMHLLPGKVISRSMVDRENNYWFSTFGDGVYKLPSKEIRTFSAPSANPSLSMKEVFSIASRNGVIYGGLNFSNVLRIEQFKASIQSFEKYARSSPMPQKESRLYTSKVLRSGTLILGFDAFLARENNGEVFAKNFYPIKSIDEIDDQHILVGTSGYVFKMRTSDLSVTDTLWRERCTRVCYHHPYYYIGTIAGLYRVSLDKKSEYLGGLHPVLSRRITDMETSTDGVLWVSCSDIGIIGLRDNKVVRVINEEKGLSSNICRTLHVHNNNLWVGTNAGLNKIQIADQEAPIVHYSVSDGLPSDVINDIYITDSIVWIGTPAGLTYFNENKIAGKSMCDLHISGVSIADSIFNVDSSYQIPYNKNDIGFRYVAVSFKSGGEMIYHYRLLGLHSDWRITSQTSLDYQSLPPGEYELELYAVNKFGLQSETKRIKLNIITPFWKTWWFFVLLALSIIGLTTFILQKRNRRQRIYLQEKNRMQQQFALLEQQALQAQMNPHFIFNCLNSIQQYIVTHDIMNANRYLTGFASLVRQTLDHSDKKTVTVDEEVSYLKQYIELEKMRFASNFSYSIDIDSNIDPGYHELPALLLQPFVENCLRHGLRYKTDGDGHISIRFGLSANNLTCTIADNGVGRKKAAEYKSQQHIEYQSKGIHLVQKRVELLNRVNELEIELQIEDLYDNQQQPAGTAVHIKIPQ